MRNEKLVRYCNIHPNSSAPGGDVLKRMLQIYMYSVRHMLWKIREGSTRTASDIVVVLDGAAECPLRVVTAIPFLKSCTREVSLGFKDHSRTTRGHFA